MRQDYLTFGEPLIEEAEIREVEATLRSGWIGTGPKVARFEQMFRDFVGAQHAVATNAGSSALHLALLMAGVGPGDEVISTPLTFCATLNAVMHTGARPVLVDVDPSTFNIEVKLAAEALTERSRAILPVHLAGRPCEMGALSALARDNGIFLIDDAAHAVGAEWQGRKIGAMGDGTCFSFYATKNITTVEGGMMTTPHRDWAERAKVLGLHGMQADAWTRYSKDGFTLSEVTAAGYKYNMTDVQASLGIHQLPRVEAYARRRREIWERYDEAFRDLPVSVPAPEARETVHARHLYTLLIDVEAAGKRRGQVQEELHQRRIGTGVHYVALHLHRAYQDILGVRAGEFPNAEYVSERTLSLPLSPKLRDSDVDDVIEAVREVLL